MRWRFAATAAALAVLIGLFVGPVQASHGPLIAFHSSSDGDAEIYLVNADGSGRLQLTQNTATDLEPAWSPDGTQIAFASNRDGDFEIYVMNADGNDVRQLTFTDGSGVDRRPAWSPDNSEILFDRPSEPATGRHLDLYTVRLDGGPGRRLTNGGGISSGGSIADWNPAQRVALMRHTDQSDWEVATLNPTTLALTQITSNSSDDTEPDWFPNGAKLAFTAARTGNAEIFAMNADGTGAVQLTSNPATDTSASVSCDASTIAFVSNRTGAFDVWTMRADGTQQVRLTTSGAGAPAWQCPTHAPAANADTLDATEDVRLEVAAPGVLGNDSDADGDALTASLVTGPAHGALTLGADGAVGYTPDPDFNGTDSFVYRATDARGMTATGTATVTVAPVNDAPAGVADEYVLDEDTQLDVTAPGVLANDTDVDEDALTAVLLSSPSAGTVALASDGSFVYTPHPDFTGVDSFTYAATDGALQAQPVTVTLTVRPVNDTPVATDDVESTPQYTAVMITVLSNDYDVDGDSLSVVALGTPAHGTITTDGEAVTYTPDHTFKGSDSFTYTIADPSGASATALVIIEEEGCGEDGLQTLDGTLADGTASRTIDRDVEPTLAEHGTGLAAEAHSVNCAYVVKAENMIEGH